MFSYFARTCETEQKQIELFLFGFLAGLSVLVTPLLMSPILYFGEMSSFKPRELP
jgi:hypothetical protein